MLDFQSLSAGFLSYILIILLAWMVGYWGARGASQGIMDGIAKKLQKQGKHKQNKEVNDGEKEE